MTSQPAYARVSFQPLADPAATVVRGPARFTVLTPRLIRMEYESAGRFEDRPSQAFWYRRQPVPAFEITERGGLLTMTTDALRLEYRAGAAFQPDTLAVTLRATGTTWRFDDPDKGNLLGTTRTLDQVDGATPLEPGLVSRDGWVVVDDSRTLVFENGWLHPRDTGDEAMDLYMFGYGRAYREALRDFTALSGRTPMLPRWALGNWWSRYWAYSDADLRRLMTDFRAHDVPLAVCIIDMDWHLVDVGEGISGWTGYTWNRHYFPDPPAFIDWLHQQGLKTALNLHPALGIRPYEAAYRDMCSRLGLDAAAGETIPFDIANPAFVAPYFELLHHPQEADGVDFWWMDWQQGTESSIGGLDPLWWLNHLHFHDLGREGKRPFIFSRWGGLGNHRYPIGFSGDTVVSWSSLAFQPYFTATAANVAYGWWSHDIGGHMQGVEDGELFTRWVQFGVFSPIFRLHSTKNPFHERRPWGYDAEVFRVTRDAMQLRHALIPYLYTMSWLNERDSLVLSRPMYHEYPDRDEAYVCPQQYLFGTDLLVAPHVTPADRNTQLARQVVWLPAGDWYHFLTGEYYRGDAWYAVYGALDEVPVFARAGSIVPLAPRAGWGGVDNPEELHLHVFPGADGRFILYEDDGVTVAYQNETHALTRFEQQWQDGQLRLTLIPPSGDLSVLPESRRYHLHIYGMAAPAQVSMTLGGTTQAQDYEYEVARHIVHVAPLAADIMAATRLTIAPAAGGQLLARHDPTLERTLRLIESFRLGAVVKARLAERLADLARSPAHLADFGVELSGEQMRALLEVTHGAGVHQVADAYEAHLLVLWNNHKRDDVSHHYSEVRPVTWYAPERYRSLQGVVPRFMTIRPEGDQWRLSADYCGLHRAEHSGPGVRND